MSGFFGCIKKSDCVQDLFYGTDYHSHLGTRRAGVVVLNDAGFRRRIHSLDNDYFRSKFDSVIRDFKGRSGIGIISDLESSPIIANSHLGRFALAMVGKISNIEQLEKRALAKGQRFAELSDKGINQTELISILICEGASYEEGLDNVFSLIKGSCSILMLTENGLYAVRDRLGRTPVIIGAGEDGYAVATESITFPNLDYEIEKYLGPGEVVKITAEGIEQRRPPGDEMQICSFLWVYYGYPASFYEGINVDRCRYNCGAALARRDSIEADCVSGIPDSGVGHAIGYSNERGIPYTRPFVKYTPTWPRSFMPQNQETRDNIAKMKLVVNKELIKDQRIIFCEDSIVRGTQLKDNTQKLFEEGAKEVHLRVACPVLLFPCEFLNFSISRTRLDLAGRRAIHELTGTDEIKPAEYLDNDSEQYHDMVEQIRKRLKLTSLMYQKMDDLVEAIGLPFNKLCTHCWDKSSYS